MFCVCRSLLCILIILSAFVCLIISGRNESKRVHHLHVDDVINNDDVRYSDWEASALLYESSRAMHQVHLPVSITHMYVFK